MKKLIILLAVLLSTGIAFSQTNENKSSGMTKILIPNSQIHNTNLHNTDFSVPPLLKSGGVYDTIGWNFFNVFFNSNDFYGFYGMGDHIDISGTPYGCINRIYQDYYFNELNNMGFYHIKKLLINFPYKHKIGATATKSKQKVYLYSINPDSSQTVIDSTSFTIDDVDTSNLFTAIPFPNNATAGFSTSCIGISIKLVDSAGTFKANHDTTMMTVAIMDAAPHVSSYWATDSSNYLFFYDYHQMLKMFVVAEMTPSPSLVSINPTSANAGQTLNVTITGTNTHFLQATWSTVDFGFNPGSGVVNFQNILNDTTINANITVPSATLAGDYDVYVDNSVDGNLSLNNGFHVYLNSCPTAPPSVTGASRCGAGSVSLHASGGNMYIWYNATSGGNIVNVGSTFNTPSLSTTTTYYVSNFDSCESARVPVTATIINLSIDAGNNQTINCGNAVTLNTNTTYNGTNSLVYAWSPTTGLSSGSISNPSAHPVQTTNYMVMVSDGVCSSYDNVTVNVAPASFGLAFTVNQQLLYAPPFAFQFTNTTPNMSYYNFTWYFGDGTVLQSNNAVVFHQYAQNGLYDVTLVATNITTGCTETLFKDDWIFCAGGTNCTHSSNISPTGPISGCVGGTVNLTCNTVSGATYQWNYNGVAISGNNTNSYFVNASGNYSVTIIVNGCPVTSNVVTVTLNNPPAVPTITAVGSLTYCGGGSVTLNAPAGAYSYLWSNGAISQSITVTTPGNYTVQVSDVNGCAAQSLPYLVGASPLANPDICLVSVDGVTGHNMIIWNEPATNAIDHFNIYGEGNQANVFNLLGSVNYSSLSIFTDNTANPMQQAYRYKISAVDTCGAETALSNYHKSIHLTINQGMGNTFNLIWSYYEGFTFSSYNIYRGTSPTNMTLLTTIASTLNSYTDLTPPVGNVYYQIEAVNPNPCTPSKTSYYSTRSNIATNDQGIITGINPTIYNNSFEIYPNPAKETITIEFNVYPNDNSFVEIFSIDSKLIQRFPILRKTTEINISSLHSGVYIIKISGNDGIGIKKLIVE